MSRLVLLAIVACVASGLLQAVQTPTNAMLLRPLGSAINAAWVSFAVGLVALTVLAVALQARPDFGQVRALPWYAWIGGLYGAVFIASTAFAAPRLGVASTITLLVLGQLVGSVAIDHFGGFGLAPRPVTWERLLGVALVLGGVVLVRRA